MCPRNPPSTLPRAFAAFKAALVRVDIKPASSSATAAICCNMKRPVGPSILGKSANRTSTPASSRRDRKLTDRVEPDDVRNDQRDAPDARLGERLRQGWPIGITAALYLDELRDDLPLPAIQIAMDGFPLRLDPQAAHALPDCRDSKVTDEIAACHCLRTGGPSAWIQLSPSGILPSPRRYVGLAYDLADNRMITLGGQSATSWLNETWILTNANGTAGSAPTWIQLTPAGTLPHARSNPVVAYDAGSNRLITFSGQFSIQNAVVAEEFNDAWVLTNANGLGATPTWIPLTPDGAATSPTQRFEGIAAYNPTRNVFTIAGGIGNCVGVDQCSSFSDVWSLSNANGLGGVSGWTQLAPAGGPPAPVGFAAYDSVNDRLMSFGGGGSYTLPIVFYNDTWVLTDATGSDPGGIPGAVNFSSPTFSTADVAGQVFPVITSAAFSLPGSYTLRLTGSDSQLTSTSNTTVTVQAPSGTPVLSAAVPNAGQQGQVNLNVTITGQNTQFIQGTTQVSFGTGISVTSVTVTDATHATAVLNMAANAPLGFVNVTVTTGSEALTLTNGFTVVAGTPVLTQVNPNTGQQGLSNLAVAISGQFTHFVQGTTTAAFGAGITVASLTVNSATSATAVLNIDSAAAIGARSVTLTTNAEVATLGNGFMVTAPVCVPPPSGLVGWWPGDGNANDIIGGNNGTLVNGATFGQGEVGQAFSFNGVSSFVDLGNPANLHITGPITIDAWVKPNPGGRGAIFSQMSSSKNLGEVELRITGNSTGYTPGTFAWFRRTSQGSAGVEVVTTGTLAVAGSWQHVAAVFDGSNYLIYVNGAVQSGSPFWTWTTTPRGRTPRSDRTLISKNPLTA